VKIGIVSDIHCNIAGLDLALEQMGAIDELVCAGDLIFQYRFSNEVVRRLREHGAHMVLGNHEDILLGPGGERARAADWIDRDELVFLAEQPHTLRQTASGKRLFIVHGSPWEPYYDYLYPHSPRLLRYAEFDADIVIMGHTHHQMVMRAGRTLLINPGSAGQARDPGNDHRLSCAVLDSETEEVAFFNYPDPARVAALAAVASSKDARSFNRVG
jgi:putative phosphoesterase